MATSVFLRSGSSIASSSWRGASSITAIGSSNNIYKFTSTSSNKIINSISSSSIGRCFSTKQPIDIASFPPSRIRNFSIIAHIDHGKTTLSTKLLTLTGTLPKNIYGSGEESLGQQEKNENRREQYLDKLQVEKERGITVKAQTCTMIYHNKSDDKQYMLNLIDTPGHVDFTYEVSRSLMACQGAILVVDACQGVQAQTMANYYLALEAGLEVVPLINKIDLPTANVDLVCQQLKDTFGFHPADVLQVSAKTGIGIAEILPAVIDRIPPPALSDEEEALGEYQADVRGDGLRPDASRARVDGLALYRPGRLHDTGYEDNIRGTCRRHIL
ncbi:hypothetical protein DFA_06365 [Cavenderia fasciculata]|uniref:Tr-type G domain-containing protein n=1 Tax=Cavenderia fasciculata TaxID=261658 RepID=F4PKU4_CACFS|nr:uncharacterized protein DFA_06365 [Cavenderia fasciculata]EGG24218.1 hypothetical protein DFA_06365 [Cavenderia fasciculata]|eukprot:XP_004362069.1 hypothetical protein DFA_06365 [Cavenderia fasciculata]